MVSWSMFGRSLVAASCRGGCRGWARQLSGVPVRQSGIEDIVRLASLASATSNALQGHISHGTAGTFWDENTVVQFKGDVVRAERLVSDVLRRDAALSSKLDDAVTPQAELQNVRPEAVTLDSVLEAFELIDMLRDDLRYLDQSLPLDTLFPGEGKDFGRKDKKKASKRAKIMHVGDGQQENPQVLADRRAELEASTSMNKLLDGFTTVLLNARRVVKVTAGGQNIKQRTLVAIGNRQGTVGFGVGKAEAVQQAVQRACRDARRNLLHIDLHQNRTLFHRTAGKFVCSQVEIWPLGEGRGIRSNHNFRAIFELAGIQDVGAKLHGPKSQINAVKALFVALSKHRSAEQVAETRGMSVREMFTTGRQ